MGEKNGQVQHICKCDFTYFVNASNRYRDIYKKVFVICLSQNVAIHHSAGDGGGAK